MSYYVDIDYASLNKHNEELCGDKVEVIRGDDSVIIVLADGLSSGVKANILATLTSKIIGTMLMLGSSIEAAVETVINTLPVEVDRSRAYTKLTILQIFNSGEGYLIEFENPKAIWICKGRYREFKSSDRAINNKIIKESHFSLTTEDIIVLLSDGAIHAGEDKGLNKVWTWEDVKNYIIRIYKKDISAKNITKLLITACNNLYSQIPKHDTTVICGKIKNRLRVNVLIGPPLDKALDNYVVNKFIEAEGKKVVCGGTTSAIAKRETGRGWSANFNYLKTDTSPMVDIEGIDLTTEGRETIFKTLGCINAYVYSDGGIPEVNLQDASSRLTNLLVNESTEVYFFLGRKENIVKTVTSSTEIPSKQDMIQEIQTLLIALGKQVMIEYF